MIIKEVELYNIRSHEHTNLKFEKGITVFSGRTGCGKSSIFMAISYALFGSTGNSLILRRRCNEGYVRLVVEINGVNYEIMRGLKRKSGRIVVDPDRLWIKENGKKLPLISRTAEINEKILSIIGYPKNIKAKELFEIVSYTKQDEIRKLINMTPAEREKYIDRVLRLNKYELAFENMKPLINHFSNELSHVEGKLEGMDNIYEEVDSLKKELTSIEFELKTLSKSLEELKIKTTKLSSKRQLLLNQIKEIEHKKEEYIHLKGLILGYEKELSSIKIPSEFPKCELEAFEKQRDEIKSNLLNVNLKITDYEKQLNDFLNLKGTCPLCHQEVSQEYSKKFSLSLKEKINELKSQKLKLESKLKLINEQISTEKKKQLEIERLNLLLKRKEELVSLISKSKQRLSSINYDESLLSKYKKDFEKIDSEFLECSKDLSALSEKVYNLENQKLKITQELNLKKQKLAEFELLKKRRLFLENLISLLKKLRDDIRSIRSVVRAQFLEDFRYEFQKEFENIRPGSNYTVSVGPNYEPLVFDGKEEVGISTLSGGEKTSVALAYRLALSDVAARVSSIRESEFLLLDEPTTGFDRQDILQLPKVLRSIKSIPQIFIISHEEELKEAGDYRFEFTKENGKTIVKCV